MTEATELQIDRATQHKLELQQVKRDLSAFLKTGSGQRVPELIGVMAGLSPMVGKDTHETYFKLGIFEVVNLLKEIAREG